MLSAQELYRLRGDLRAMHTCTAQRGASRPAGPSLQANSKHKHGTGTYLYHAWM